ncbi:MAG: hypothetical protein ACYDG4_17710, partial [Desulfuromonadaceae bacterium]
AGIMPFQADLKTGSDEKIVDLIRHVILSSLLSNKKKFSPKFGEMVICADGRNYWRKEHFSYYKASRSKNREASGLNWKLIFDTISSIRDDLEANFPYRVMHVNRAEADDIIGVLSKYLQDNDMKQNGLEEEPQKILILSSDKDNVQLQKFRNVTQYSPMQKKQVKPDTNAREALIEKICCGDPGDGYANIMSDDDVFVTEGKRQKPFKKARLPDFYKLGIDACANDTERRNYQRNELLASYEMIPADLQQEIINTYKAQAPQGSKKKIMAYLMEHRCRNLLDSIEEF